MKSLMSDEDEENGVSGDARAKPTIEDDGIDQEAKDMVKTF